MMPIEKFPGNTGDEEVNKCTVNVNEGIGRAGQTTPGYLETLEGVQG